MAAWRGVLKREKGSAVSVDGVGWVGGWVGVVVVVVRQTSLPIFDWAWGHSQSEWVCPPTPQRARPRKATPGPNVGARQTGCTRRGWGHQREEWRRRGSPQVHPALPSRSPCPPLESPLHPGPGPGVGRGGEFQILSIRSPLPPSSCTGRRTPDRPTASNGTKHRRTRTPFFSPHTHVMPHSRVRGHCCASASFASSSFFPHPKLCTAPGTVGKNAGTAAFGPPTPAKQCLDTAQFSKALYTPLGPGAVAAVGGASSERKESTKDGGRKIPTTRCWGKKRQGGGGGRRPNRGGGWGGGANLFNATCLPLPFRAST